MAGVFGGGPAIDRMSPTNIGERNAALEIGCLKTARIPIMSNDVLGILPRKVCSVPAGGRATVERLAAADFV